MKTVVVAVVVVAVVVVLSDQGSVNSLDPEACCSNQDMHVWKEGGGPLMEHISPNSSFNIIGRDSEDMEVTQRSAPSLHLGHIAAGSGYQQTKQATFFKPLR